MSSQPIGVFDSGIGGLTVLQRARTALPGEDLLYFGDTARVPYGTKGERTVRAFARQDASFLVERGVKLDRRRLQHGVGVRADGPVATMRGAGPRRHRARRRAPPWPRTRGERIGVIATRGTMRADATSSCWARPSAGRGS